MPAPSALTADGLVKNNLAERFRAEIISGALPPEHGLLRASGHRDLAWLRVPFAKRSTFWRRTDSSRESGRSARVIHLSERAVTQLYELRGAVEGLAARLRLARIRNSRLCRRRWTLCGTRQRREIAKACSITIYDFTSNYARSRATLLYWSTRAAFCSPSLHLCECE
jgi:hypothetical protein